MPSPPTPGAVAYTAYVQARYGMPAAQAALTYQTSIPAEQTAWEAAAQAVLALRPPAGDDRNAGPRA